MRFSRSSWSQVAGAVLLALTVGCAGQVAPASPPLSDAAYHLEDDAPLNLRAKTSEGLYVVQFVATSIGEYRIPDKANQGPFCYVHGVSEVNGIGIGPAGVLYVPLGDGTVLRFAPNCGHHLKPLQKLPTQAVDVAFDRTADIVYVGTNGGQVFAYEDNNRKPSNILCCVYGDGTYGIGVDSKHNVYQSDGGTASIYLYRHSAKPQLLPITGLAFPGGLTFDKHNNMLVTDSENGILVFAPPYSGSPTTTIHTRGSPIWAKLNNSQTALYVSDGGYASVDVYAYPSGKYEYSITAGLGGSGQVGGLAIAPLGKGE